MSEQLRALKDAYNELLMGNTREGMRQFREALALLNQPTHAGERSTATVALGAETAPLPSPAPTARDAGGVVDYLLSQLVQVKGPAKTVMWESPDGKGGQFAGRGVALMCWLNRAVLPPQAVDVEAAGQRIRDIARNNPSLFSILGHSDAVAKGTCEWLARAALGLTAEET